MIYINFTVLLCVLFYSHENIAQKEKHKTFEGVITFKIEPVINGVNQQTNYYKGSKRKVKQGDCIQYKLEEKTSVTHITGDDTLYIHEKEYINDEIISTKTIKNADKIAGIECDLFEVETLYYKAKFYYNKDIKQDVDPAQKKEILATLKKYKKLKTKNFKILKFNLNDYFLLKKKSIALKEVIEYKGSKSSKTAIKIENMTLNESAFTIPVLPYKYLK